MRWQRLVAGEAAKREVGKPLMSHPLRMRHLTPYPMNQELKNVSHNINDTSPL